MKKSKRSRKKVPSVAEIENFCQSVEDVLTKINENHALKKSRKTNKKSRAFMDEDGLVGLKH